MPKAKDKPSRSRLDPVGPAATSLSPRGGAKHGRLKEVILEELRKAGEKGLSITDLAARIEVLKSRVTSWFSSTGRHTREVRKIGVAHWQYVGQPSARQASKPKKHRG